MQYFSSGAAEFPQKTEKAFRLPWILSLWVHLQLNTLLSKKTWQCMVQYNIHSCNIFNRTYSTWNIQNMWKWKKRKIILKSIIFHFMEMLAFVAFKLTHRGNKCCTKLNVKTPVQSAASTLLTHFNLHSYYTSWG